VLGGALIAHAARGITHAFPDEVRTNAMAAVRRRPRVLAVAAAIATWTLVYALYSLAYPSGAALLSADPASAAGGAAATQPASDVAAPFQDNRELLPPSLGGEVALPPDATATVTPEPTSATTTTSTTTTTTTTTTTAPAPEPAPCPVEAIIEAFGPQAVPILCAEGTTS
jgi:hypothetical protein